MIFILHLSLPWWVMYDDFTDDLDDEHAILQHLKSKIACGDMQDKPLHEYSVRYEIWAKEVKGFCSRVFSIIACPEIAPESLQGNVDVNFCTSVYHATKLTKLETLVALTYFPKDGSKKSKNPGKHFITYTAEYSTTTGFDWKDRVHPKVREIITEAIQQYNKAIADAGGASKATGGGKKKAPHA